MTEYIVDYELIPLKWRDGFGLSDVDLTEEVVRCRDCKYFHPMEGTALSCRLPHPQYGHLVQWQFAEPDGYCWRGKRKEDCDATR